MGADAQRSHGRGLGDIVGNLRLVLLLLTLASVGPLVFALFAYVTICAP
jgi:hypothetical protein